jgi:hypothetical protein
MHIQSDYIVSVYGQSVIDLDLIDNHTMLKHCSHGNQTNVNQEKFKSHKV